MPQTLPVVTAAPTQTKEKPPRQPRKPKLKTFAFDVTGQIYDIREPGELERLEEKMGLGKLWVYQAPNRPDAYNQHERATRSQQGVTSNGSIKS